MKYSGADFKMTSQANHLSKLLALLEESRRDSFHMQRLYKRRRYTKDGYIDMIGTDHAPHTQEDKENGAPGISNIEVAFQMVNKVFSENQISLNKLSEMMSANPAKLLGLNQGLIEEGLRADLVLIDENCENVIDTSNFISKGKNNPFN